MAVATSAHRVNQIVVPEERCPVHTGELRALVRVDQHGVLWFASPHRHEQSLQYDVRGLAALQCPANDPTGIEVDDDSEICEALTSSDVGNVRDPGLVRSRYVKLPVERVADSDGRPAAVDAGTAFVANLRPDPGETGQTCNPVRATHLALVEKIVVQLAITVDLAALFPCLQEQVGLSLVLAGSPAQRVLQPGAKSAGMNPQKAAHRPHRKRQAMHGNERLTITLHPWRNTRPLFLGCHAPR